MFDSTAAQVALAVHVSTWCLFAVWILLDPFYCHAVDMLLIDLRVRPQSPFGDRGFHAFHKVGWRLWLLSSLSLVAIGSATFLVVAQLTHGVASIVHFLTYWIIIAVCWLVLIGFHSNWYQLGMPIRVRFVLPTAERLAAQLNNHWPTSDGVMPWVGEYSIDSGTPNMLTARNAHSQFPLWEPCGIFIRHDPAGIVRFDLASRPDIYLSLEVFLNGGSPCSYVDTFDGFSIKRELQGSKRLRDHVYLTWYESEFADVTDDGMASLRDVIEAMTAEMAKHGGGDCRVPRDPDRHLTKGSGD